MEFYHLFFYAIMDIESSVVSGWNKNNYKIIYNYKVIYKFYNMKVINNCGMNEAANTIENWLDYICNSFIYKRFSNGFTEGLNNKE